MKRKKLVLIGPAYPYRGGNSLFMNHLHEALSTDFDILFINFKLMYPSLLFPGKTQYDVSASHYNELKTERLINSINPFSWIKTAKRINAFNPDMIVFDWWQPYFGLCYRGIQTFLSKENRKKKLFIMENFISHEGRFIDKYLTHLAIKDVHRFIALSQKVINELEAAEGKKKVYKSELPIYSFYKKDTTETHDLLKQQMGISKDDKVLLFFGYVRKYKGLDILIETLQLLLQKDSHYKLLVAGEFYDDPKEYFDLIERTKTKDHIILRNEYIPNEEVAQYFEVSDMVVLPYRNGTQSGIMNMAYGNNKPVIATNVGGLAEFIDEDRTGVIVNEISPEAIAAGIEKFYVLKTAVDFESNIQQRSSHNSFNSIANLFKTILNDL
jgi:glycosyltransferase involved in cell wall biosynthesis